MHSIVRVSIAPDTKDWTWVLHRPCEECRFDASAFRRDDVGRAIRENAASWAPLLRSSEATRRIRPDRWSVLEYACHVRDVLRVFDGRLMRMLSEDGPTFENWDQNETATFERYDRQDPSTVSPEIVAAADTLAARYESVTGAAWNRPGTRSNGSRFTVETLAIYGLHDPIHHLWDVTVSG
jgi:hypothetical protein